VIDVGAVADGVLVNALWAVGQMLSKPPRSQGTAAELEIATWMDTDALTQAMLPGPRLGLEGLQGTEIVEMAKILQRSEVQAALQTLLAARLTDAPEKDATEARKALRLALSDPTTDRPLRSMQFASRGDWDDEPETRQYAVELSEYFDDKISAMVAHLEGKIGFTGLAQVRSEAYSARMICILSAIHQQVKSLSNPERRGQREADWLIRYRRQVEALHGFLYPPDFDRRRKISIASIYVDTPVIRQSELEASGRGHHLNTHGFTPRVRKGLTVMDLVKQLDRTVLLGDPGGGKTTAANAIVHFLAKNENERVPFLVTLREYATGVLQEHSIVEHIERNLGAIYQIPAPPGLLEQLLYTGRAVVVFDGLDELLDTSRRRDVSRRVEQFTSAYPLSPVLVTSRIVGYDQARLDDSQFHCYRLANFNNNKVAEYVGKWFSTQEDSNPLESSSKAKAFLVESEKAKDIRSNPLLLSLMCILYRGAGSLPGDRTGIYAKCAELMLRKWDEQRDLYRKVQADHLIEPTLRYLAWWLFTREDTQTAATESELEAKTTQFLLQRGFESEEEARNAAREFIDFCRGRIWVFSDAGATPDGDKLYAFTHRTFMEYFAAWQLAATSDTPEDLAARLVTKKFRQPGRQITCELAIQIKAQNIDRGADRVYAYLLDPGVLSENRDHLLPLLINCLPGAKPTPEIVRRLTRAIIDNIDARNSAQLGFLLRDLIEQDPRYGKIIKDEFALGIEEISVADTSVNRQDNRSLALDIFFELALTDNEFDKPISGIGLFSKIPIEPSDFSAAFAADTIAVKHLATALRAVLIGDRVSVLTEIGQYLATHETFPWVYRARSIFQLEFPILGEFKPLPNNMNGLGAAAVLAMCTEIYAPPGLRRQDFSELSMPNKFRPLFREWAQGAIDFVAFFDG